MKLITELNETVSTLFEKTEDGAKRWYIEGVFLQSNIKNRNGRVYPVNIMEREVNRYMNDYVSKHRAVGELGHPDGPSINLDRVSHKIVELRKDGDNFMGKAQILNTPMGKIVQSFLEDGVAIGVSSRGMGSLKENSKGIMEVQDDFYLATAGDIVSDPSAPDAWVNGIMEGVDWVWNNGVLMAEKASTEAKISIEEASRARALDEETKFKIMDRLS